MIKFKAFCRPTISNDPPLEDQVNEWLASEKPKTIIDHSFYITGEGLTTVQVITLFYETNPAVEYMKKGDQHGTD